MAVDSPDLRLLMRRYNDPRRTSYADIPSRIATLASEHALLLQERSLAVLQKDAKRAQDVKRKVEAVQAGIATMQGFLGWVNYQQITRPALALLGRATDAQASMSDMYHDQHLKLRDYLGLRDQSHRLMQEVAETGVVYTFLREYARPAPPMPGGASSSSQSDEEDDSDNDSDKESDVDPAAAAASAEQDAADKDIKIVNIQSTAFLDDNGDDDEGSDAGTSDISGWDDVDVDVDSMDE